MTDRQQVRGCTRVMSFLHGFWGAVFLLPCLWDRGWHTCDTAITASPASCCLSQGHLPFSVRNKPRLVTAGTCALYWWVLRVERAVTRAWACGDMGLGVREQTPVQVWALDL